MTIFLCVEVVLFLFADRPIAAAIQSLDATHHALIDFFRHITDLGKSVWYLWPCGLAALFCAFLARGKDVGAPYRMLFSYIGIRALFIFVALATSGIIADIIKPIVGRARPLLWLRDGVYGFHPLTAAGSLWNGMPSGHTTTAFALAASLSLFYPRLRILWVAYAVALGASRVMVDAHYLSDVCAGAMLGWLTVEALYRYGNIHRWHVIFPIDRVAANR